MNAKSSKKTLVGSITSSERAARTHEHVKTGFAGDFPKNDLAEVRTAI